MHHKKNNIGHTIPFSLRVKLLSSIALLTSVLAMGMLGLLLFFVGHEGEPLYTQSIQAHVLTQHLLGSWKMVAGLALLALVALITWFTSLHVSLCVAGPLFRFGQNFEAAIQGKPVLPIRSHDYLQQVSGQMNKSLFTLHDHYLHIRYLSEQAEERLLQEDADSVALKRTLQRVLDEVRYVRLD